MSLRYPNGAVIKPGFNPVLVPGAPSIGLVTPGSGQVIVAFTAPTDTGGSAITSYQVVSSPGSVIATGASSPITVTGLTDGTAYTFRVAAINSYGAGTFSSASASATPVTVGQQAYTTAGTYSWIAPAGVTSVSIVAVGGGGRGGGTALANCCNAYGGGGGGGGGLGYKNNYSVIPGNSYTVVVGAENAGGCASSYFCSTSVVRGINGGNGSVATNPPASASRGLGGSFTGDGGGAGGNGGPNSAGTNPVNGGGGGGGAGGYAGTGGTGGNSCRNCGTAGSGGGGGGGGTKSDRGSAGGGVGILGQGSNGAGGLKQCGAQVSTGGGGGSGGAAGGNACSGSVNAAGGAYGGGGGGSNYNVYTGGSGAVGAVRIIWPGTTRSFPSTNTGNL